MTDRTPVVMLDPAAATPGQVPTVNPAGDAVGWADGSGGATALVPWTTTTSAGEPVLMWDADDHLMMIEESP